MMLVPLITDDIKGILDTYHKLKPESGKLTLRSPFSAGFISYSIPSSKREVDLNDLLWLSPMFLSCL